VTGGQFREVDFDLLADYVGGALDGTPDEAEVARLIAEDPAWAESYAALTAGVDAVRLDLAALAAEPEPMPPAVVDRLDAALARPASTGAPADPGVVAGRPNPDAPASEESPARSAPDGSPEREPGAVPRRPGRPPAGIPVQPRTAAAPAPRRPGRRRRWTRRVAGPVLAATVVAGFGVFAISRLGVVGDERTVADSAHTVSSSPEQAPMLGSGAPQPVPQPSAQRVLATGTDYTSGTLAGAVITLTRRGPTPDGGTFDTGATDESTVGSPTATPGRQEGEGPGASGATVDTAAPPRQVPGLERLADPEVLTRCLEAVASAHGRGPIRVDLVDFASFEGRASLVIVFSDAASARWAWVTGPGCGTSPAGADVTYRTRVG